MSNDKNKTGFFKRLTEIFVETEEEPTDIDAEVVDENTTAMPVIEKAKPEVKPATVVNKQPEKKPAAKPESIMSTVEMRQMRTTTPEPEKTANQKTFIDLAGNEKKEEVKPVEQAVIVNKPEVKPAVKPAPVVKNEKKSEPAKKSTPVFSSIEVISPFGITTNSNKSHHNFGVVTKSEAVISPTLGTTDKKPKVKEDVSDTMANMTISSFINPTGIKPVENKPEVKPVTVSEPVKKSEPAVVKTEETVETVSEVKSEKSKERNTEQLINLSLFDDLEDK